MTVERVGLQKAPAYENSLIRKHYHYYYYYHHHHHQRRRRRHHHHHHPSYHLYAEYLQLYT
jgi:hypothetical protein